MLTTNCELIPHNSPSLYYNDDHSLLNCVSRYVQNLQIHVLAPLECRVTLLHTPLLSTYKFSNQPLIMVSMNESQNYFIVIGIEMSDSSRILCFHAFHTA